MGILDLFNKDKDRLNIDRILSEKESAIAIIEIDEWLNEVTNNGTDLAHLNSSQLLVLMVENLEREVNNGGFYQFYLNSFGGYAQKMLDYLREIGAYKTAYIVERANNIWPDKKIPVDLSDRQEVIQSIQETHGFIWEECDHDFYKYEDDLSALLMAFVKEKRSDFE